MNMVTLTIGTFCRDILAAQERKAEYEANSVASSSSSSSEQPLLVQFYSRLQQHIWEGSELSGKGPNSIENIMA